MQRDLLIFKRLHPPGDLILFQEKLPHLPFFFPVQIKISRSKKKKEQQKKNIQIPQIFRPAFPHQQYKIQIKGKKHRPAEEVRFPPFS